MSTFLQMFTFKLVEMMLFIVDCGLLGCSALKSCGYHCSCKTKTTRKVTQHHNPDDHSQHHLHEKLKSQILLDVVPFPCFMLRHSVVLSPEGS
jgi:hypothetical protein